MSSEPDRGRYTIPRWVFELRPLLALTGSVATLSAFAESPREFILNRVLTTIVDGILSVAGWVAAFIVDAGESLATIPWLIITPLLDAGSQVTHSLAGAIEGILAGLSSVATATGPAAPIVTVLLWVGLAVVVIGAVVRIIEALPRVLALVIPWL